MSNRLAIACRDQAVHCDRLGSPFMVKLMGLLADNSATHPALRSWENQFSGDIGPAGISLPLRIAGGLQYLVVARKSTALAACYPPNEVPDTALWDAVDTALISNPEFWNAWLENAPQTNEVRRSVALIAAAHYLAAQTSLPFHLSELGASAGLNLMFDQFSMQAGPNSFGDASSVHLTPDWIGTPPEARSIKVASRRGVDLNPLNSQDPETQLRLLAYLWADQPERATLTKAAIAIQNASVDQGDAIEWLESRLSAPFDGLHLIYHTIAWQYFPEAAQVKGTSLIESSGESATADRPLAWLRMENDASSPGAALTLRLWPGDLTVQLGRVDFHGRWMDWQAPQTLDWIR
ncbi:MAG: DUF2332 domain-containing protein [Pseudomonadota bacterium]|nr:DUF2332 domain-containing protein [Pseudomonadota bacterium]